MDHHAPTKKRFQYWPFIWGGLIVIFVIIGAVRWVENYQQHARAKTLGQTALLQYQQLLKSTTPLNFTELLKVIKSLQQAQTALGMDHLDILATNIEYDDALKQAISTDYKQSLQKLFLPLLSNRLEQAIVKNLKSQAMLYPYLTAYLMLHSPDTLNKSYLLTVASFAIPQATSATFKQALNTAITAHFQGLPVQPALISAARKSLSTLPLEQQAFIVLVSENLTTLRLFKHLKWFKPNTLQTPYLYTAKAFQTTLNKGIPSATQAVLFGNVTLGTRQNTHVNPMDLNKLVYNVYFLQYANYWDHVLSWIHPKRVKHRSALLEQLKNFSGQHSELIATLTIIHRNTNLVQINLLSDTLKNINQLFSPNATTLNDLQQALKHLHKTLSQSHTRNTKTLFKLNVSLPTPLNKWIMISPSIQLSR